MDPVRKFQYLGRSIILFLLLIISIFLLYIYLDKSDFYLTRLQGAMDIVTPLEYNHYENELVTISKTFEELFIKNELPITNLSILNIENTASGDDILSESIGLLMLNAIKNDDNEQFDNLYNQLNQYFQKENGLFQWKINLSENKAESVNASVDDLRIVKALFRASIRWNAPKYKDMAIIIGDSLYEHCVNDNKLLSFDSADSENALLVYYDIQAILFLSEKSPKWEKVLNKSLKTITNSQVKGYPFYKNTDEEIEFPSIENLMILMHLYEVGIEDRESIDFIKRELKTGAYFGLYSQSGYPLNEIESPAIYGIIAQIAKLSGDEELYHLASKNIIKMMQPSHSEYKNAFVDPITHIGYSFDHLMAMLGL